MFQLINGTIECGECRMTFDMAASIIAAPVSAKIACFAMRMDAVSQFEMVKGGIFEFDCVKNLVGRGFVTGVDRSPSVLISQFKFGRVKLALNRSRRGPSFYARGGARLIHSP